MTETPPEGVASEQNPKPGANPGDTSNNRKSAPMSDARYTATQRLIEENREEFEMYYREEAEKRGLKTKQMRREERVEKLKKELAELEGSI